MSERIQNVKPKEYNGRTYRSTLEAETAKVLDSLGISFEYEQKKIILLEGFSTPFQKEKVRALTYTPDFTVGTIIIECKGFETPEWKIKKKLVFKYLEENEPWTVFYQIHDARKQLLTCLDNHWPYLGYSIQVTSKPRRKNDSPVVQYFDSVTQAMEELGLSGKPIGAVLRSLTGNSEYVYGYNWKLIKTLTNQN